MIGNKLIIGFQTAKDVFIFPLSFRYMRGFTVTFDNAAINFKWLLSIELFNKKLIIGKER